MAYAIERLLLGAIINMNKYCFRKRNKAPMRQKVVQLGFQQKKHQQGILAIA